MADTAAAGGGGGAAGTTATDYRQIYRAMTTPQLIQEAWEQATDAKMRDQVVATMAERERTEGAAAWPSAAMATREQAAGLYPDPADPQFAARLYGKREFYEARAVAAGVAEGSIDPCTSQAAAALFELTPVQRVVSRFMHPQTPYMGLLLFHGVGVGKTNSAVAIAEQFLEAMPQNKVIVLAPQALKENFRRSIFNPDKLVWDATAGRWTANQATGVSYLERLGLLENPDLKTVLYRVEEDRRSRYTITGYQAFANWIERTLRLAVPASVTDPAARRVAEDEVLRRLFSDHLIIVDEAHNLRDTAAGEGEGAGGAIGDKEAPVAGEAAENAGGKALNPYLKRIVLRAEGLRLVFMTATPMYNSAPEIVLLLNYLLMNDTKSERGLMRPSDMFTRDGDLNPGAPSRLLERLARRYVSYMRGENPYSFPLRMRPAIATDGAGDAWPTVSATRKPMSLTAGDRAALNAMPLVFTEPVPGSPPEVLLRQSTARAATAPGGGGGGAAAAADTEGTVTDAMLDARIQMANITYPNSMYGGNGWNEYFAPVRAAGPEHRIRVFGPRPQEDGPFDVDTVFAGDGLRLHAPKIHRIVESVRQARGICFAYSRYINGGALALAAALERAGFQRVLADGKVYPLLTGVTAVEPVCALCGSRRSGVHADHPFRPARYVLLTSEDDISPQFAGLVRRAATWPEDPEWGPLGGQVKVVIGSQVASEGLDLKCIREMHVMDPWYHLNRIEKSIGRAIRYCSHTALRAVEERLGLPAMAYNNCLIYLHALNAGDYETADLYAYRIAIAKAAAVGRVQRLLKKNAWDCNLELEAITFTGLPPRRQVDAAGRDMPEYSVDDQDYTTYCDYQQCRHECAVPVPRTPAEGLVIDESTFGVTDARRTILAKQAIVRRLFDDQLMVPETMVQDVFSDLPWEIASEALMELLDGQRFRLTRPDGVEGFLVKKAGYVVFQPALAGDTEIPLALRYARAFQLKRHMYDPRLPVFARADERPVAAVAAAAAPAAAAAAPKLVPQQPSVAAATTILDRWRAWAEFVAGRGPWPGYLPSTLRIWSWFLRQYADVPSVRSVALQWWLEKIPRYPEQRFLLERALDYVVTGLEEGAAAAGGGGGDPALAILAKVTEKWTLRTKQLVAYVIFNPETQATEYFCRKAGEAGYSPCTPKIAEIVARETKVAAVGIPADVGPIFGFLTPKKGQMIFKTLTILTADARAKGQKQSKVGAECGNISNLGEHHPRIRMLHAAASTDAVLGPKVLPDDPATWDAATAKTRQDAPAHMLDLTHQPLCLYMEFLSRMLEERGVGGRRWFLTAPVAAASGLKGRA